MRRGSHGCSWVHTQTSESETDRTGMAVLILCGGGIVRRRLVGKHARQGVAWQAAATPRQSTKATGKLSVSDRLAWCLLYLPVCRSAIHSSGSRRPCPPPPRLFLDHPLRQNLPLPLLWVQPPTVQIIQADLAPRHALKSTNRLRSRSDPDAWKIPQLVRKHARATRRAYEEGVLAKSWK